MKNNDAPRIIIQLIISALIFFFCSFKYKSEMISFLSDQVYYQVLIILVIMSGYVSRWIDNFRVCFCHHFLMTFAKSYRLKQLKEDAVDLSRQAESSNISDDARRMMSDIASSDFELEKRIESLFQEIKKIKKP